MINNKMTVGEFNDLVRAGKLEVYVKIGNDLRRVSINQANFDFPSDWTCIALVREIAKTAEEVYNEHRSRSS